MTARGGRHAALAAGEKFYVTGKPCKNGHIAKRHAVCGRCSECWTPSRAKSAAYTKAYYERHPGKADEIRFRYRYGVELSKIRPKPRECELCGKAHKKIVFDHDHATGQFRGWLCDSCNIVLGNVGDDPSLLLKMVAYLKANGRKELELGINDLEEGHLGQPEGAA